MSCFPSRACCSLTNGVTAGVVITSNPGEIVLMMCPLRTVATTATTLAANQDIHPPSLFCPVEPSTPLGEMQDKSQGKQTYDGSPAQELETNLKHLLSFEISIVIKLHSQQIRGCSKKASPPIHLNVDSAAVGTTGDAEKMQRPAMKS